MDGWMCRGEPAALQPVPTGSHGPRVAKCDACAAPGSTVDVSTTLRSYEGVPRHVSTCVVAREARMWVHERCEGAGPGAA